MNVAGYVLTTTTVVKRYKVHMLTGKKYLVDTRSELKVKVYAQERKGYSLHRSFSFNLRHR
ncbi:hypothetical protein GOQ27_06095 [Clostridium sp. D2Q-11]|uniref:Uncharacterized protein n=1 Tax=Anaeromonas frigoriresistens TaxID=2683708 RepID=A0A942UWC5_9FIRM|nr:hypothetical protein [Anaeromonas frigoriresistens]MBS4538024.1 hypothetical protein [Anaeromonas frigoriresistens]